MAKPVTNLKPALRVVFEHDFVSGNGVCENLHLHLWPCHFICGLGFDLLPAAAVKIGNSAGGPPPPPHPSWPQPRDELTCPAWDSQFLASCFPWITNSFKFPKYFFFPPLRVQRHEKGEENPLVKQWGKTFCNFILKVWSLFQQFSGSTREPNLSLTFDKS